MVKVVLAQSILVTTLPAYGTGGMITGQVAGIANPQNYCIHMYIFVSGSGWWSKPYAAYPKIAIQSDSTFSSYYATGGSDIYATRIKLFLADTSASLPLILGATSLPDSIAAKSIATFAVVRHASTVSFDGITWETKNGVVGPGPSNFNFSNVFVDTAGLHLLQKKDSYGNWTCGEVVSPKLGYGYYEFTVNASDTQPPPSVFGAFIYCEEPNSTQNTFAELDLLEKSRWNSLSDTLGYQNVVQPYTLASNINRFSLGSTSLSTHQMLWTKDSVVFTNSSALKSHSWVYKNTADIPDSSNDTRFRFNLWFFTTPADTSSPYEIVIKNFKYTPLTVTGGVKDEETRGNGKKDFYLRQNYPNPFNPVTVIEYFIPTTGNVTVKVYDILGKCIQTLADNVVQDEGGHTITFNSNGLSSGIYFYRMNFNEGGRTQIKKMVVLK
jgi:hypothetical protein